MKKICLVLLTLLSCVALATPVYADIAADPNWLSPDGGRLYIVIGVAVLIVGLLLWAILRARKK